MLRLFFMVPVAVVCYSVASEGFRTTLAQAFAVKVHRLHIPFVHYLAGDEFGHKLDLASLMSLLLVFGVCMVTERLVEIIILNDVALTEAQPAAHVERKRLFLMLLGPMLLFADAALFYIGIQKHAWGVGAGTGLPAMLATIVYVALLVTAAYVVAEAKHG
jgi:hypothetical protein